MRPNGDIAKCMDDVREGFQVRLTALWGELLGTVGGDSQQPGGTANRFVEMDRPGRFYSPLYMCKERGNPNNCAHAIGDWGRASRRLVDSRVRQLVR